MNYARGETPADWSAAARVMSPSRSWDSAARSYVEHDTTGQETFGELPVDAARLTAVGERIAEVQRVEVGAVPAANDNGKHEGCVMDIPDDVRVAANMVFNLASLRSNVADAFAPSDIYSTIEQAILAERKRCADVVRRRLDGEADEFQDAWDSGYFAAATNILSEIEAGA